MRAVYLLVLSSLFAGWILLHATAQEETYISYLGYSVIRASITSDDQVAVIMKEGMDVWSHDSVPSIGNITIMVNTEQLYLLKNMGVDYHVINPDMAASIAAERELLVQQRETSMVSSTNTSASPWYNSYHPAPEIFTYLQQMSVSFPSLMQYVPAIGQTIQGNSIPAVILTNRNSQNQDKKRIFVQGGQHAREWIGPATVVFLVESLVVNYTRDDRAKELMDNVEFYVVPLLNVDGYIFTWTSNRLWRKNRRLVTGNTYGVDLNRNYEGALWCELGASKTPSSDTYCGTAPFSEPETKASSDWAKRYAPFSACLDYHSYSQYMLRPWSHTNVPPADDAWTKYLGDQYVNDVQRTFGRVYISQAWWQMYYATGTASDYWTTLLSPSSPPYSYTVELRPSASESSIGFQLPPAQIIPTGQENWNAFANFVLWVTATTTD